MEHTYLGKTKKNEGYCDDPYCTGHTSAKVNCSCGWHTDSYSSWDDEWQDQFKWVQHVLKELQR